MTSGLGVIKPFLKASYFDLTVLNQIIIILEIIIIHSIIISRGGSGEEFY